LYTETDDHTDDVKLLSTTSQSSSFNDEERLFRYLFRRYNKRIRPVRNSSEPVHVAVTFSLMQIHHLVSEHHRHVSYLIVQNLESRKASRHFPLDFA